jgi:hypothetical protein
VHRSRQTMIWLNLIGGVAVLGSYAHGLSTRPDGNALWGGVPEDLRGLYTVSMLCATVYFEFASYFLLRVDPEADRLGGRAAVDVINVLYGITLASAAAWMPLTWKMIDAPSEPLWWAIRLVLGATGLGAVGLFSVLIALKPRQPGWWYRFALIGLAAFCFQTAVLDALVWTWFFRS